MSLSLREVSQLLCQLKVLDQKITKVFEEQVGLSLTRYELLMIFKRTSAVSSNGDSRTLENR